MPSAIGFIVGSQLSRRGSCASCARPTRWAIGLVVAAVGLAMLAQVDGADGLAMVVAASVIVSLGLAPGLTVTTELVVGSAPPERAGAASGISETSIELGGALGLSILGTIGIALYRHGVGDALPAGVPPELAATARDTLGGAVAVAAQLPAQLGAAVVEVARTAFVDGMQAASLISAVVAVLAAVIAVVSLRNATAGSGGHATVEFSAEPDVAGAPG